MGIKKKNKKKAKRGGRQLKYRQTACGTFFLLAVGRSFSAFASGLLFSPSLLLIFIFTGGICGQSERNF
jgi:hypothetical protein